MRFRFSPEMIDDLRIAFVRGEDSTEDFHQLIHAFRPSLDRSSLMDRSLVYPNSLEKCKDRSIVQRVSHSILHFYLRNRNVRILHKDYWGQSIEQWADAIEVERWEGSMREIRAEFESSSMTIWMKPKRKMKWEGSKASFSPVFSSISSISDQYGEKVIDLSFSGEERQNHSLFDLSM